MAELSYHEQRGRIEAYFDRTAAAAWARLTSTPRWAASASVRAGRDRMRDTLLSWLPQDLSGARVLDAGCGTGALAVEAARRGAQVVAVDLSPTLVTLAAERVPAELRDRVRFVSGDMLDAGFGRFDHVVLMDSLIHYEAPHAARALELLASRCANSVLFTFAPRTPLLAAMHAAGRLFPRGDRAPAIVPVAPPALEAGLRARPGLQRWQLQHSARVANGFYISQAMALRSCP